MINKKLGILPIALMVVGFSSCLKEGNDNINPSKGTPNVVEFANTGSNVSNTPTSTYPRYAIDLGRLGPDETAEFAVNLSYSGVDVAPSDITLALAVDETTLALYNSENNSDYDMPTADLFILPTTAVIKKGEKTTSINVKVKRATSFDFDKSYALPIKIVSSTMGTISGNFGKAVYSFTLQNQYDGTYADAGYLYHPSSPRALSGSKRISTIGASSVSIPLGDLGGSGYTAMVVIDPVTNKLTVSVASGAAGGPYTQFDSGLPTTNPGYNAAWSRSAACNNTYDPATKTFYLRYGYVGGTGWRVTEEILTLQ